MKRRLLAGALAATMALSMTACGSGGGSSDTQGSGSSDGSPTTLNLILRAGAYADVIKECLPKFEEEHNVKCEDYGIKSWYRGPSQRRKIHSFQLLEQRKGILPY